MRRKRLLVVAAVLLFVVLILPLMIPLTPVGVEAAALADPDGFFVEIDGLSVYVLARGPEDGKPVLLLHGWGASTFSWRENIDVLAQAGYRAVAYDRPPYGLSAKTGDNIPYSGFGQADFAVRLMDRLGIQSASLVGSSAGGGVIGYFAVHYPERSDKLVFVDGVPLPTDDEVLTNRRGGAFALPGLVRALLDFPPFARWVQIGIRQFITPGFASGLLVSAYHNPDFVTPEIKAGYERPLRVVGWDEALLHQLRGSASALDPLSAEQLRAVEAPS